ncbi:amidohydrolase family protein [Polaromonas sp.]|uniref:amidohydrolase family protein n=1 Tax=Polaromonas sp. TaxID=1869339 RepID=UPI002869ECBD|nr:amidohydrolase family protein [Polaromonas sp.]
MNLQVIRNVRPLGGSACDVVLEQGVIKAMMPAGTAAPGIDCLIDGQGQLLLPALVDSHVHFDKTLWGTPWRANTAGSTRNERIANEQGVLGNFAVAIADRAGPLIEHCIAKGSLYFRCHVDAQTVWGLRHIEAMLELRQKYASLIDMQLVTFPQGGMLIQPGTTDLMRAALDRGVDIVGGIDPATLDRDPIRHLETLFDLATGYGRGIDIHLHEPGELGRWQIERIADMTRACGLTGRVMISHAYSLGAFPPHDLLALADRLAELDISIMTCVLHQAALPVAMLRSRGVNVCSGSDGIRDAWSPSGNGDMLARASLLALRSDWNRDQDLAMAFDIVTAGGAHALGLTRYGLAAGCQANLVLLPAENLAEAVVNHSQQRTVISRGKIVARDGVYLGH